MQRKLIISLSLLLALHTLSFSKDMYLNCSLSNSSGKESEYNFWLDSANSKLNWSEGEVNFKITHISNATLIAIHDFHFATGFEYDVTALHLNRITGKASISYSRKPTKKEKIKCEKAYPEMKGKMCDDYLVLTEYDENGTCSIIDRVIK